jgi:hypothetical protein
MRRLINEAGIISTAKNGGLRSEDGGMKKAGKYTFERINP